MAETVHRTCERALVACHGINEFLLPVLDLRQAEQLMSVVAGVLERT